MTTPDSSHTGTPHDVAVGLGKRLRAAREAQGLSARDVARRLHLDVKHIEAIERDEFDKLIAPVFVQGYLRNYARLLNFTPESVIKSYGAQANSAPQVLHGRPWMVASGGERAISWVIYALILAGAVAATVWWQNGGNFEFWRAPPVAHLDLSTETALPAAESMPNTVINEPTDATAAPVTAQAAAEALEPASTASVVTGAETEAAANAVQEDTIPIASEPVAAEDVGATSAEGAPPAQPAAPLTLRLSADSWVEIIDASGKRIVYGLLPAGTTQAVEQFTPPLRVVLGNAQGVNVEYNGEAFDTTPYQRSGVARFNLGVAQAGLAQ